MKYLYCLSTNPNKFYHEKFSRVREPVVRIHDATVRNDPDDFLLCRREMEAYGYRLVILTDKEYFLRRLADV